jgi:hypothetical protein
MKPNVFIIAGFFFLFVGTFEIGSGLVTSLPYFGVVGGPGLLGVIVGIALIMVGIRRGKFSKHR